MFEPEDSWHEFEAMIDEFSDSETPNETMPTDSVSLDWKDDSDSELYFSDSAMSEDSQLNLKLQYPTAVLLTCHLSWHTSSPSSTAVQHIEDMVLSFLTQLAMPGGGTKESTQESDIESTHILRAKHKIEMRLIDRTKIDNQGWLYPLHLKGLRGAKIYRDSAVKCIRYPKKSKHGSAKPLG